MSFKKLATPAYDANGEEYTHKCGTCTMSRAYEYFGVWIEEETGEFGDDRWVIECFNCGTTEEA